MKLLQMIYLLMVSLVFLFFCYIFPKNNNIMEGYSDIRSGIQNIFPNRQQLSLCQYMMMCSCDSAYDGKNVTKAQLVSVIKTGCRFLDFQVFYEDNQLGATRPYVDYTTDPYFEIKTKAEKRLTLTSVLSTIATSCFGSVAPNTGDPVFIHLRIKSNNYDVYDRVAEEIKSTIESRLFVDQTGKALPVTKDTLLSSLLGKIIIVVDRTLNTDYLKATECPIKKSLGLKCSSLNDTVNIETGGIFWNTIPFNPPTDSNCMSQGGTMSPVVDERTDSMGVVIANRTSIDLLLVVPPIDSNPDVVSASIYISNLGCQNLMYRFYLKDSGLSWYKNLFNVYKTAFIPMGYAVSATSIKNVDTVRILL